MLAQKFGYTPNQIANMSPAQQLALCGVVDNTITFNSAREYQEWFVNRNKL